MDGLSHHEEAYQRVQNYKMCVIAHHLLGKPTNRSGREWRYGKKGSIAIKVAGARQGLYANFETGESGNVIKFIADQMNIDRKDAFKWGEQYVRGQRPGIKKTYIPQKSVNVQQYVPIFPIPVPSPDLKAENQLHYLLKGRHEVGRFEYKDADGKTLGYVVRLEDKEGNKITPTLTYCKKMGDLTSSASSYSSQKSHSMAEHSWRFQGFGEDRPLYGLDVLKQNVSAPVLIVEGEKTCDAARNIFKDHAVITWNGGCGSVHKSDWSVLKDRDVTIWPDHDKAGETAAHKIAAILKDHAVQSVSIVELPSTLPHKWDLADTLPHDMHYDDLMNHKIHVLEKEIYKIPKKTLQSFSKILNIELHDNPTEKLLIDGLYHVYRQENPDHDKLDALKKAVIVGFHMHNYSLSQTEKNSNNIYELTKESYKIGLNEYHKSIQNKEGKEDHDFENNYNNIEKTIERHGYFKSLTIKENIHLLEDFEIEKIAKMLGTSLSHKYKEYEIALINIIYKSYQKSCEKINLTDLKIKAVSVGIYLNYDEPINSDNFF